DDALAGEEFDIVLTDWFMPDMKGDELIRELRDKGFKQPMVLWSASFPPPKCPEATTVVHKSVGLPGIAAVLRDALKNKP
ncbi:response regulator transcription factor, partial [Patescibacteria group bacterium]